MKKAYNQSSLVIFFNALSIALVLVTLILLSQVVAITADLNHANANRFDLTLNANRFMNGSIYLTDEVRAYAATGNTTHYDNYWNEINTLKNRDIGVANMKEIGITAAEQAKIDEMAALSNNLVPLESAAMDLIKAGRRDAAIESVFGAEYDSDIAQIESIKADFLAMLETRTKGETDALIVRSDMLEIATIAVVAAIALLQIVNTVVVMRKLISPVKKIQKEMEEIERGNLSSDFNLAPDTSEVGRLIHSIIATKAELNTYIGDIAEKLGQVADGNLDVSIDMDYLGDFMPIKTALQTIVRSLNDTLSQIHSASQQVFSGSAQVADGAQLLARGSTEQAAAVQQLSASVSEVAARTAHNADMASKAAHLSASIRQSAQSGAQQMDRMMAAMQEINEASTSIGKVIAVIDNIAFQTNILALNAAVEAARAGQHGKGFAVVADEVRNLATKSAAAAKDTGSLISGSMEKARLGLVLAQQTAASLQEIVGGIDESASVVEQINDASGEQTMVIAQIDASISQVSQVVQQNSAAAEESAAAAEEMSSQSAMLEQLVELFRLKEQCASVS